MTETNIYIRLWDYFVERCAYVHNVTSRDAFKLQGLTPRANLIVDQSDISNSCQFGWFEWICYRDNKKHFLGHK